MKKVKVKNWTSYKELRGKSPEKTEMPSKTVPDQTLSLTELLLRHTRGQQVATFYPTYQNDDEFQADIAALQGMDEMDRLDYLRQLKLTIHEQKKLYREIQEQKISVPEINENPVSPAPPVEAAKDKK